MEELRELSQATTELNQAMLQLVKSAEHNNGRIPKEQVQAVQDLVGIVTQRWLHCVIQAMTNP